MISIGVKIPLAYSTVSGFDSLLTIKETYKQNFKMLLLTDPGERIMNIGEQTTRVRIGSKTDV